MGRWLLQLSAGWSTTSKAAQLGDQEGGVAAASLTAPTPWLKGLLSGRAPAPQRQSYGLFHGLYAMRMPLAGTGVHFDQAGETGAPEGWCTAVLWMQQDSGTPYARTRFSTMWVRELNTPCRT